MRKHPFTVRRQTSGYTGVTKYIVVRDGRQRVTTWAHLSREAAQADADALNIVAMVADYTDDPRPYAIRRAEAEATYETEVKSR